jgi:hypothetical protein
VTSEVHDGLLALGIPQREKGQDKLFDIFKFNTQLESSSTPLGKGDTAQKYWTLFRGPQPTYYCFSPAKPVHGEGMEPLLKLGKVSEILSLHER